jgi:hypothetical protein
VAARALAGQAHHVAQDGKLDRAHALYGNALAAHPNPDSIRIAMKKVRERRDRVRSGRQRDTAPFRAR